MEFTHFHDSRLSVLPTDSGFRTAVDNRWQSNIRDTGYFSVARSIFHCDKTGFSGRRSNSRKPLSVNRVKLGIPYKSQMCTLFQEGKCYCGENCHFAHSLKEIRKTGISDVSVEANVNEDADASRKAMWEMKEYHYFSRGEDYPCGKKCQFLCKYEEEDLSDASFHYKSDLRKTKLCNKWERFGSCPYGVQCRFAHGKAELRKCSFPVDLEMSYTSRFKLALQPCEIGIGTAETEKLELRGKRRCKNWSIKKISQIYADWVDKDLNSPVSLVDVPK